MKYAYFIMYSITQRLELLHCECIVNSCPYCVVTLNYIPFLCFQPRDTCYIASPGLPDLIYSGYQPHVYSWDDFPPLKDLLESVRECFMLI